MKSSGKLLLRLKALIINTIKILCFYHHVMISLLLLRYTRIVMKFLQGILIYQLMSGVPLKRVTNKMTKTIKLKKNFLREIRVNGKEGMKASNKTSAKLKKSTW